MQDVLKGAFWRDYWRRKGWTLAMSAALHVCLLLSLFATRWRLAEEQPVAPAFIVEAWGSPSPAPAPSPAKGEVIAATEETDAPPEVEVTEIVEAPIEAGSPETVAGAAEGAVASCDLANAVRATLQADAAALAAVALLPRDARSAASAVMLWDGAWLDAPGAPGAVSAVQRAVGDLVNAASAECRSKAMTGPQFIILDDARGATVLVIGSGAWRWADLIDLQRAGSI